MTKKKLRYYDEHLNYNYVNNTRILKKNYPLGTIMKHIEKNMISILN